MVADRPDVRFLSRKWAPAVGGMETYCVRLTEELRCFGKLDLMVLPGRRSGRPPTVTAMLGFGVGTAARLLAASEARIVHAGDLSIWPLAWLASLRHPRSKIVLSAHGSDLSFGERAGWRSRLYAVYLRAGAALLPKARIIANSRYIARLAEGRGFRNVTIVRLGTDYARADAAERSNLLYAGRITRSKGLRFLVEEVLPLLPDGTTLRVAGPVWETSEEPLLENRSVEYLGVLSPETLATEYARAVAVLIPTRQSEGFGLAAIEAAACGAFVIASDHSGLVDAVQPPIGITVDADDPKAWADQIRLALSEPEEQRRATSKARRAEVDKRFRWCRTAEDTWNVYQAD